MGFQNNGKWKELFPLKQKFRNVLMQSQSFVSNGRFAFFINEIYLQKKLIIDILTFETLLCYYWIIIKLLLMFSFSVYCHIRKNGSKICVEIILKEIDGNEHFRRYDELSFLILLKLPAFRIVKTDVFSNNSCSLLC